MNAIASSEIRDLTADEIDQASGGLGFLGLCALGLFTGAAVVSGVLIVGMVAYAKLSE